MCKAHAIQSGMPNGSAGIPAGAVSFRSARLRPSWPAGVPSLPVVLAALVLYCAGCCSGVAADILFEGFESAFPGANWVVGDDNTAGPAAYWGAVSSSFGTVTAHTGTGKGYCAGVGYAGSNKSPSYTNNMTAYMRHDLDLRSWCAATLSFWYRVPAIESCCDYFRVSVNGTLIFSNASPTAAWRQVTNDLSTWAGTIATLEFAFISGSSGQAEGVYLDDIAVSAPEPAAVLFEAWWDPVQDQDGDGCVSVQGDRFRLNWDPDVSCAGGTLTVYEKIYRSSCGSPWALYTTTAPHLIQGESPTDVQYLDIPSGSSCACYNYQIEIYRAGQTLPDFVMNPATNMFLGNHREELTGQDQCAATIAQAWWGPLQDRDNDGCLAATNDLMRLYWDPNLVNCSGPVTVFEKIYFRPCGTTTWFYYSATPQHVITGTSTTDQQYLDIPSGVSCACYDYRIDIYRSGRVAADDSRDPANEPVLGNHREESNAQDTRPILKLSRTGSDLVLYWPTNLPGFALQATPGLSSPAWSAVSPAAVTVGSNYMVTNSAGTTNRFYRLSKP
jgi:hypothetical protein